MPKRYRFVNINDLKQCNLLLIDVNQKGLEETAQMCKKEGAPNVIVKVADVTNEMEMKNIINAFDEQFPIDAVYPCAALNDTPRKPLPNTVSVG